MCQNLDSDSSDIYVKKSSMLCGLIINGNNIEQYTKASLEFLNCGLDSDNTYISMYIEFENKTMDKNFKSKITTQDMWNLYIDIIIYDYNMLTMLKIFNKLDYRVRILYIKTKDVKKIKNMIISNCHCFDFATAIYILSDETIYIEMEKYRQNKLIETKKTYFFEDNYLNCLLLNENIKNKKFGIKKLEENIIKTFSLKEKDKKKITYLILYIKENVNFLIDNYCINVIIKYHIKNLFSNYKEKYFE